MTEMLPPLDVAARHGARSRFAEDVNGLRMHLLEAGEPGAPLILLLHGFPELAWSWRRIIAPLAQAGFHVVAPDLRGFGRTTGWDCGYDCDLSEFGPLNVARDLVALLHALGGRAAHLVAGHDSGAGAAAVAALVRPDLFRAVALMSAPFTGPPPWPGARAPDVSAALARLDPPRAHYQRHYSSRSADAEMRAPPQGLHAFLRAYYHMKSGDWAGNRPYPLAAWSAEELAKLPEYYVMRAGRTMPDSVAPAMPTRAEIAACRWLPDEELAVYAAEYARTGFQGGLNWYRCRTTGLAARELSLFAGRTVDLPACFIAGARDWGIHQTAGALEAMRRACPRMEPPSLVDGAGHWVQQEAPEEVGRRLLSFLRGQEG